MSIQLIHARFTKDQWSYWHPTVSVLFMGWKTFDKRSLNERRQVGTTGGHSTYFVHIRFNSGKQSFSLTISFLPCRMQIVQGANIFMTRKTSAQPISYDGTVLTGKIKQMVAVATTKATLLHVYKTFTFDLSTVRSKNVRFFVTSLNDYNKTNIQNYDAIRVIISGHVCYHSV